MGSFVPGEMMMYIVMLQATAEMLNVKNGTLNLSTELLICCLKYDRIHQHCHKTA